MTPTEMIIVGARGLGKELVGLLDAGRQYRIVCVLDELPVAELLGHPVIHPQEYAGSCRDAFLAVGYPRDKATILEKYAPLQLRWRTYTDPRAHVSPHATIGIGCLIGPFAYVGGDATIGDFTLVCNFAGISHDSVVGDHCSLMPHAYVCGDARVSACSLIAAGATVLLGARVGEDCQVSAGVSVRKSVAAGSMVTDATARRLRRFGRQSAT